MIDLSQSTLVALLLYSLLLGVILGVFYDVMRFIRLFLVVKARTDTSCGNGITVKGVLGGAIIFVFDVIFFLVFAVSSLILTYNVSGGVFRGMVYFGMLAGGAIYYLTVGRLTLKLEEKLVRILRRASIRALRLVLALMRPIFCFALKIYHLTIGKIIGKIVRVTRERRQRLKATANGVAALPQNIQKENDKDVTKYRYEREGRICFGQPRNKR